MLGSPIAIIEYSSAKRKIRNVKGLVYFFDESSQHCPMCRINRAWRMEIEGIVMTLQRHEIVQRK